MARFRLPFLRPTRRSRVLPAAPARPVSPVESLENRVLLATFEFGNSTPIWIENGTFGEPGQARPYPAFVTASGVTGAVRDIRVTFYGFNHERPADVDILLVSPNRDRGVILISDAGANFPVEGVDLTIATDATRSLPEFGQITGGSYRVTNYDEGDGDAFPGNVPDGMPTHESLIDFASTEVNGVWHLYVVDDDWLAGQGGIPFGWSITFITGGEGPPAPSVPDMTLGSDTGRSNTDNTTRDATPTFTGTATGAASVNLYSDGVNVGTATVSGSGTWTVTAETLVDGDHVITARAVSATGDEGDASGELSITIDTQAPPTPAAPSLAPESDTPPVGDNATGDTTPTLIGNVQEAVTVALFADGSTALGTGQVDASGNYSVTPTTPLSAGSHTIVAGATDLAGNTSPLSEPLTLRIEQIIEEPLTIAQVFVGSPELLASNAAFRTAAGVDPAYGYAVPGGATQLTPLSWLSGIRTVAIRTGGFGPQLEQSDLVVRGSATPNYGFSSFTWDQTTRTGVWTLSATVTQDKLRLVIDDAAVPGLDGDWNNGADTFPSGNSSIGGDFNFRINVLAGDVSGDGQVNATDVAEIKRRLTRRPNDGVTDPLRAYTIFSDVNGDGVINANDLAQVKARLTRRINDLPEPA